MDEAACIPVVSLGEALDEASPHAYEVAHDIGHALTLAGAFYVCDHGIAEPVLARPFEVAQELFALPASQRPAQLREVRAVGEDGPPDSFGCFSLRTWQRADGQTQRPGDAPSWLLQALARYEAEMARLSRRLLQLLAQSLDRPRDALCPPGAPALRTLRLLRYPAVVPGAAEAGARAHTDRSALTLLAQDGQPGLEVENGDGQWLPVRPRAGALLVHLGEGWGEGWGDRPPAGSNVRYRALRHRVRRTGLHAEPRLSVPFFFTPLAPPRTQSR